MRPVKALLPAASIGLLAACGSSPATQNAQEPEAMQASISFQGSSPISQGNSVEICGMRQDTTGNPLPAAPSYRCSSSLGQLIRDNGTPTSIPGALGTPAMDFVPGAAAGCPCFEFDDSGRLMGFLTNFDPTGNPVFSQALNQATTSEGTQVVIPGLCPSIDLTTDGQQSNWTFTYTVWEGNTCGIGADDMPIAGAMPLNGPGASNANDFICFDQTDLGAQAFPNETANEPLQPGPNSNHIVCETTATP